MPRSKLEFSEEQLNRPTNFIVVLSDTILDVSPIDIDQANRYVDKYQRRAIVLTTNKSYDDIETVSYRNIMNAVKPCFRKVDTHDDEYLKVYQRLSKLYKNGLIIACKETVTSGIAQILAETQGIGLDIVIHRESPVILTAPEIKRVNYFRIHKNDNFGFSKEFLEILAKMYGEVSALGISLAQYITNYQYTIFNEFFTTRSLELAHRGMTDFIDNDQYTNQLAFHVYYDMVNDKITGLDRDKCIPYIAGLLDSLGVEWTEELLAETRNQYFHKPETDER